MRQGIYKRHLSLLPAQISGLLCGEKASRFSLGTLQLHAVWEELTTLSLTPELGQSEHCIPRPRWLVQGWERDPNRDMEAQFQNSGWHPLGFFSFC